MKPSLCTAMTEYRRLGAHQLHVSCPRQAPPPHPWPMLLATLALLLCSACGPLLLPGHRAGGLSRDRQQCVECSLRDGLSDHTDQRAANEFRRWCDAGDPASCSALGVMYETGRGMPRDVAKAEAHFQQACQQQNGTACVNLGRLLSRPGSARKDDAAAAIMFEMACVQGELDGCFELGQLHVKAGRTTAAATVFDRSCSANHSSSCETLGVMFAQGQGLTQDAARAEKLFRRACLGGSTRACEWLGHLTAPRRAQSVL